VGHGVLKLAFVKQDGLLFYEKFLKIKHGLNKWFSSKKTGIAGFYPYMQREKPS
jgi:hypothetical protein